MVPRLRSLRPRVASAPSRVQSLPKEADAHYQTPEHRAWAADVIRRAGGRCQHPDCTATRADGKLYADHIVEIKDGGAPLDPANGQALCAHHHGLKTARERERRMADPVTRQLRGGGR